MKLRLHSILLLLGTFLLGMLLGALLHSNLQQSRLHRLFLLRDETTLTEGIRDALGPLAPEKAAAVDALLATAAPRIIGKFRDSKTQVRQEIEILKSDLAPHLTEEQQTRLADRFNWPRKKKLTQSGK